MPSSLGIFTSRIDQVGPVLLGQLDRRLAVAGLADDVVPLLGEHLGEVHPDQRLVLGDDDPAAGDFGHEVRLVVQSGCRSAAVGYPLLLGSYDGGAGQEVGGHLFALHSPPAGLGCRTACVLERTP